MAALGEPRTVQTGEALTTAGERATRFFILVSGTLLVAMDNGKALVVNRPGDFIGLNILSEKGVYRNTLTALAPGEVLAITRDAFPDIIQEESPAGQKIMTAWNAYLEDHVPFLSGIGDSVTDYNY
ncbi:MAG: cyclic nucleotide-binding domain-containing protein [Pseudomonadota bacterium]